MRPQNVVDADVSLALQGRPTSCAVLSISLRAQSKEIMKQTNAAQAAEKKEIHSLSRSVPSRKQCLSLPHSLQSPPSERGLKHAELKERRQTGPDPIVCTPLYSHLPVTPNPAGVSNAMSPMGVMTGRHLMEFGAETGGLVVPNSSPGECY